MELYHHGILGQHWGIRRYQNADGTLTNAGKKRYLKDFKKAYADSTSYRSKSGSEILGKNSGAYDSALNSSAVKSAVNDLKEASTEADNFCKEYIDNQEYYDSIAAINSCLDSPLYSKIGPMVEHMYSYNYEGEAYGDNTGLAYYIKDNGLETDFGKVKSKLNESEKKYKETSEKAVNDLLGEYGKLPVATFNKGSKYEHSWSLSDIMQSKFEKDSGLKYSYASGKVDDTTGKVTKDDERARTIVDTLSSKLGKGYSYNLWTAFALVGSDGLDGYYNKSFDELTDSDWKKIDSVCKQMKEAYYSDSYSEELYHHGILGQRWGIRRYQNADGTLTPAGKKRADKLKSEYEKITGDKSLSTNKETRIKAQTKYAVGNSKSLSERDMKSLTDDELKALNNRMQAEIDYQNKYNQLNPKPVETKKSSPLSDISEKFLTSAKNKIPDMLVKAGTDYLEKTIRTNLQIPTDAMEKAKKEADEKKAKADAEIKKHDEQLEKEKADREERKAEREASLERARLDAETEQARYAAEKARYENLNGGSLSSISYEDFIKRNGLYIPK